MVKSIPINDSNFQKELCELCQIGYDPSHMAYKIEIDEKLSGILTFKISGTKGYIKKMATLPGVDDFGAMFISARGALNFLDLHGIHDAYFEKENVSAENEALIKMIGFRKQDDGEWYMNLRGFFTGHTCSHNMK